MKAIYTSTFLLLISALFIFNGCRPPYAFEEINPDPTLTSSIYGGTISSSSPSQPGSTSTFASGTYIYLTVSGTGGTTNYLTVTAQSASNTYTLLSSTSLYGSSGGTFYNNLSLTSPTNSTYTLTVTVTTDKGKTVSQVYYMNPALTTYSTKTLYRNYSTYQNCFNFSNASTFSYAAQTYRPDIWLSEYTTSGTTTFNGTASAYGSNYYIAPVSSTYYTTLSSQGDLAYRFSLNYQYSNVNLTTGSVYIIRTGDTYTSRPYAMIKITSVINNSGINLDYVTFEYKY